MTGINSRAARYDKTAPRKPVNLSLNAGLLVEVSKLTLNLSETVESLLEDYVQEERARRDDDQKKLNQVIDAMNNYHNEHGFLSEQLQNF